MKKTLMFACVAAAMLVSCGGNNGESNTNSENGDEKLILADSTECVKSAEVAYVDLDAMFKSSKIFAKEGKPLEKRVEDFQKKMASKQEDFAKREQGLVYEQNKVQQEYQKLQSDYQKGLITTLNAQSKGEQLEKRAQNAQAGIAALQKQIQQEGETLQKEEQTLAEEHAVLENRFRELLSKSLKEINADGRYKMIVNSMMVVDAADGLDISSLVLSKIDELYEKGVLSE